MASIPVSIVMPLRDAGNTLSAAIESLLAQTYPSIEIVLIDHLSVDHSPDIIREFMAKDQRIRALTHSGSFVEAANLAWQKSSGDLIARMDCDDIAHPDRIAEQVNFLSQNPEVAACGTQVRILKRIEGGASPPDPGYQRYEKWVNSVISSEDIRNQRFVDSPIPNPTSMIRREVMEALGGYQDPEWAEDYDFWLRLIEAGYRLGKVERKLLDWFDSEGRSTRTQERYALPLFQAAKATFLSRLPAIQQLGVVICGAGPIGKEMATLLRSHGIHIHAFLEVNHRQIGNRIAGIPVLDSEEFSKFPDNSVALSAVGQDGARERIRKLAIECGFSEGKDFFCVA